MVKLVNGKAVEMTDEEIASFEAEQLALPRDTRTQEEILAGQKMLELENALQNSLDSKAKELGFVGDDTTRPYRAISNYLGYENDYRADAEKLGAWFAQCFKTAETLKTEVLAGARALPTVEELLAEMPVWSTS